MPVEPVAAPPAAPVGEMPPSAGSIGPVLQATRERLGWTVEDVENALKIKFSVIEALESGDRSRLPPPAYAVGFVRAYARFLGLDHDEIVKRFKAEEGISATPSELKFPLPLYEARLPRNVLILFSVMVAVTGYAFWYYASATDRTPIPRVATVPEQLAVLAGRPEPSAAQAASPQLAAVLPGEGEASAPPAVVTAPLPVAPPPPAMVLPTILPSAMAPGAQPIAVPQPAPAAPPVTAAATDPRARQVAVAPAPVAALAPAVAPPEPVRPSTEPRIVMRANRDVRVELRETDGTLLFNKTMRTGDSFGAPNRPGLILTVSRRSALDFFVDGRPVATPADRSIALDPDRLRGEVARPAGAAPAGIAPPARPAGAQFRG